MTGDDELPWDGGPLVYVADLDEPRLEPGDRHHLARVRRVHDGDEMIIGDGRGHWRTARFAGEWPTPESGVRSVTPPAPAIGVAFALVKGAKPELVVQKLTELGIDDIRPFVAVRSVVRWDDTKAVAARQRWIKVAQEAARQSRRAWLPAVHPVVRFEQVAAVEGACRADRHGGRPALARPLILIGPEGGWDIEERACGLPAVSLGRGVLRSETAAITAAAMLSALRDGLVTSRPESLG